MTFTSKSNTLGGLYNAIAHSSNNKKDESNNNNNNNSNDYDNDNENENDKDYYEKWSSFIFSYDELSID